MTMDLFKASSQAGALCMIYCKAQADLYLEADTAVLVRLTTAQNQEHIVWMDPSALQSGVVSIVRAFYEVQSDFEDDIGDIRTIEVIKPDSDIFCYNGESYYLYKAKTGNHTIRQLRAYATQAVVEEVERQSGYGKGVESVFLSNLYLFDGQKRNYALTCWGVVYEGGCSYLPVFSEDQHYVEEYDLGAFIREEVPVGGIFKNNGYYYKLMQDDNGKLYLDYNKMVFTLNKDSPSKKSKFESTASSAKIVSFKK